MANRIIGPGQPIYAADDAPPGSIRLTCGHCAKVYAAAPCMRGRKFCSWDCRVAARRAAPVTTRVASTCEWCGSVRELPKAYAASRRFCSSACRGAADSARGARRAPTIDRPCGHCGVILKVIPSRLHRVKFCSRACQRMGQPFGKTSAIADAAIALVGVGVPEHRVSRWSVDLAFPERMLAVELDGVYWHSLPAMVDRDRRKDADLTARGWTVRRIVIVKEETPESLADKIRATIAEE